MQKSVAELPFSPEPESPMCRRSLPGPRLAFAFAACAVGLLLSPHGMSACPPPGEELQVNQVTEKIQQSSSVAMDAAGGFVVTWQSEIAGNGDDIRARRFDACGVPLGDEIAVNAVTKSNQNAPAVALDADGDFVIAWQTLIANNYEIRARRFDSHGVPRGDELAVNTRSGDAHGAAAVAMDRDGDFVVVWESAINGSYEIRARLYDAGGVARSGELAVNTVTASSQRAPAVAMDAAGAFVVAWRSNVSGRFEVRAQRFKATGEADGAELTVNSLKSGDQLAPAIAMDADGDFVAAWESSFDGSFEIRARRFDAKGVAREAEFPVNAATAGNQFSPTVAMDARGDFVVAWQSLIAGSYEIRARGFSASGSPQGAEIAVNATPAGTQKSAAAAMDADGDFVVVWHGDVAGNWDIAARRGRLRR
jgi:hypothetical protein